MIFSLEIRNYNLATCCNQPRFILLPLHVTLNRHACEWHVTGTWSFQGNSDPSKFSVYKKITAGKHKGNLYTEVDKIPMHKFHCSVNELATWYKTHNTLVHSKTTTKHQFTVTHYFKDFNISLVDSFIIFYSLLCIDKIKYPVHTTVICTEEVQ
jgi:hypothetical protein